MLSYLSVRQEIVAIGRRLAERRLVAGSDGNISAKVEPDRLLVTPSGFSKGRLEAADLVMTDTSGRRVEGTSSASSELPMHLFAYAQRSEIGAVVHAHPPYATAFAVAGVRLPGDILPEVVVTVGDIPLAPYAPPGTEAVPRSLAPFMGDHDVILLRNHGLLAVGRTLDEAYNRLETVEHFARILCLARQLGDPGHIPPEDLRRLKELRGGPIDR